MYAVVDTNVLVSSMITGDDASPTVGVMNAIVEGLITPIYNQYLIKEYLDVLKRDKFSIPKEWIKDVMDGIIAFGLLVESDLVNVRMVDVKDLPIYSLVINTLHLGSYLITGNIKHFPEEDFIITPREAMTLLGYYHVS